VPVVRTSTIVVAPRAVVFDAARDIAGFVDDSLRPVAPGVTRGFLAAGDAVVLRPVRGFVRARTEVRVTGCASPGGIVLELERGPWQVLRYRQSFASTGAGTLVTDELEWRSRGGALGSALDALIVRRRVLRLMLERGQRLRRLVGNDALPGVPGGRVVVGVALLDGCRVLAAQRSYPSEYAGRWELPGGKVEAGESSLDALRRECREELGVEVSPGGRVGPDVPIGTDGTRLQVWSARVLSGHPTAREHQALRWLAAEEVDDTDWLPADRVLVPYLHRLLTDRSAST
jgi:8-oxo-dGTP diphosphatase